MGSVARRLPDFPWDRLAPYREQAARHPDGVVDLSIGTPVDPTPEVVQQALRDASDAPGYPTVWGTVQLRASIIGYLERRCGSVALTDDCVLPTIGSKELVAALPAQLGMGAGDTVLIPEIAYPTYAVGGLLAGADLVPSDSTLSVGPTTSVVDLAQFTGQPDGKGAACRSPAQGGDLGAGAGCGRRLG
ncbi:MAG: aminotransferase class I/II-fold pyridoxal phosphate-dependent enzyme [Nocardioidaceae bacterium]